MRVIFLDVDGVLNSEAYLLVLEEQHRRLGHTDPVSPKHETTCDCFKLYHQIDRAAVSRLNRLVEATGAKVVISSSWRKLFDPPEMHRILGEHGLVAEIIGETPDGHQDSEMQALFGGLGRILRGHEIDAWLRRHPEVDRFVILDDGSDMAMHRNRLVQTDAQEGLLDEHVDLALRVMAWDGVTMPSPFEVAEDEWWENLNGKEIVSTRSNESEDARRDFDGFSVDEELQRLRLALRDGQWRAAGELAANLDEHLSRGGSLPVAWLGPACMQEGADLAARLRPTAEAAAKLSPQARRAAVEMYVAIGPPPAAVPTTAWGIHCNEHGCVETLELRRTMAEKLEEYDIDESLSVAQTEAAMSLGWRLFDYVYWCPTHVAAKRLACARCLMRCPACSCVGGPRLEAVEGVIDVPETTS